MSLLMSAPLSVGMLVGCLVGRSVGQSVGRLIGQFKMRFLKWNAYTKCILWGACTEVQGKKSFEGDEKNKLKNVIK